MCGSSRYAHTTTSRTSNEVVRSGYACIDESQSCGVNASCEKSAVLREDIDVDRDLGIGIQVGKENA